MPRGFRHRGASKRDFRAAGLGVKTAGSVTPNPPVPVRTHLGVADSINGISYPLRFANGSIVESKGMEHLKESISQILGTQKGESLMRPEFGSSLPSRVFDPVNTLALAQGDIRESLRIWEPRIQVMDVSATTEGLELGIVELSVEFRVKNSDERDLANIEIGS